jgi:hypothetical protein
MSDLERWIEPYFRDSTLWPVLVVAVSILVTLVAAALLLAVVDRHLYAMAALLALAWMSGDAMLRQLRSRRRLGLVGGAVLGIWALGAAAALAARLGGLF